MSDLISLMSSGISSSLNLKKISQNKILSTPILYKSNHEKIEYTFIVDELLSNRELGLLKKIIEKSNIYNYQILYALQIELNDKNKKMTIWKTYRDNKWNFSNYISPWSKVISFGKSIFSICESNDFDASLKVEEESDKQKKLEKNSIVAGFYDTLLEETHFNDPQTKCVIFPVDSWYDIYSKDTGLFLDRFEFWFFKQQLNKIVNYKIAPIKIKPIRYEVVENPNQWLEEKINNVQQNELISFDLETDTKDPFLPESFIINISFSFESNPYLGYYLDWTKINPTILTTFLLKTLHIGSYISYDYKWLIIKGNQPLSIIKRMIGDTFHEAQIYNTLQRLTLKSHVWYLWYGGYDKELDLYIEAHPECKKHYSLIPKEILIPYAAQDPCMSLLVHRYFKDKIQQIDKKYPVNFVPESQWSMWRFYSELRINTQKVFTKAEIRGMEINWDKVKKLSDYVQKEIKEKERKIRELLKLSEDINLNSNDQLGTKLEELKWKNYGRSKKGIYNVNDYTLQRWTEDGHKEAKLIDELHKLNTIYRTFIGSEEEGNGYYQYKKSDGKVHSTFGVGINSTGRNNSRGPNLQNCFSKDTEILTEKGWTRFDELQKGIKVAQYDQNTENISFTIPQEYIKDYQNKILHIYSDKQIDLLLTKDHQCLLQNRKNNKFFKVEAKDYKEDYKQIIAGYYKNNEGINLSQDQIIFICALQADGYINYINSVTFRFNKLRKVERLKKCLDNMKVEYSYKEYKIKDYFKENDEERTFYNIYLLKKTIDFDKIITPLLKYKFFDYSLLNLNDYCRDFLIEEIFYWDGNYIKKNCYSSSIKQNCDVLQALFTLSNKRSRIREYFNESSLQKNINYQLDTVKRNYCMTTNHTKEIIDYNDYVYCVTVPDSNIIIRRNGKVAITGNCKKHGYLAPEMRDFFTPSNEDIRCLCEQDGASLQLRIEASLSGDKEMARLFKNNIDMHSLTGHMLFGQNMSFEDFCHKVKSKEKYYTEARYSAKAPNFSLAFNSTALSFAKESLYTGTYRWSFDQAKNYINLHNLQDLVQEKYDKLIENPQIHDTPEIFCYYWACAQDIKEKWMKKYPGIQKFILYKIAEGEKYGVCFTPYGFIRRIPWLRYCTGSDENKGRIKNNQNTASNVGAQTIEWVMISKAMISEDNCIEENSFNSYITGNVHDSIVNVMYYDEAYKIFKSGQEAFCEDVPENKGIPYGIECAIGIWGFNQEFDLEELKDIDKIRELVIMNNKKQRSEMVYEKVN